MKLFKFLLVACLLFPAMCISIAQTAQPPVLDPSNAESILSYWDFLYVILTPVLNVLISRFWPSNTKQELTIKTSVFAITILIAVLTGGGFSAAILGKAVLMFFTQSLVYDKVLKPMGVESTKNYKK